MSSRVFRSETSKSIMVFIKDLGKTMALRGFIIHNEDKMEMVHHFGHHGVELAEGFDLNMVQVCSPKKSALSMMENLERAVLLPKFIVVFSKGGKTQIRMLLLGQELVADLVDDEKFPGLDTDEYSDLLLAIKEAL